MTVKLALKNMIPLLFSYIFVGIAFGILVTDQGFPPYYALFCAALIYAGSMQIVLLSLLSAHMPLWSLAMMTFFINARHLFYGLGFLEDFKKAGWKYPILALTLTDETYSIYCSMKVPQEVDVNEVRFYIGTFSYILWFICCGIGAYFGDILPDSLQGIDFSAVAFFVTVVANQWQQLPTRAPIYFGALTGILGILLLGKENFLLPAIIFSAGLLLLFKRTLTKEEVF